MCDEPTSSLRVRMQYPSSMMAVLQQQQLKAKVAAEEARSAAARADKLATDNVRLRQQFLEKELQHAKQLAAIELERERERAKAREDKEAAAREGWQAASHFFSAEGERLQRQLSDAESGLREALVEADLVLRLFLRA